jgi:hypothetical protein
VESKPTDSGLAVADRSDGAEAAAIVDPLAPSRRAAAANPMTSFIIRPRLSWRQL